MCPNKALHSDTKKIIASIYNGEILNYFKPELQIKDTESDTKSTLIESLTQKKVLDS